MPYTASAGSPRRDTTATMFIIIRVPTPNFAADFTVAEVVDVGFVAII